MSDREVRRFDLVSGFSLANNPSGPWAFGSAAHPGDFESFSQPHQGEKVERWSHNAKEFPDVLRNVAGKPLVLEGALLPTDALILRPAHQAIEQRKYSTVRFTAPTHGSYRFQGMFEAISISYGGTSQLIVHGVRKLAENAFINSHGQIWDFDLHQDLRSGENIDFLLGPSPHGDNSNDSTALALTVTVDPSISAVSMGATVVAALAGLVAWRLRRRRQRVGETAP